MKRYRKINSDPAEFQRTLGHTILQEEIKEYSQINQLFDSQKDLSYSEKSKIIKTLIQKLEKDPDTKAKAVYLKKIHFVYLQKNTKTKLSLGHLAHLDLASKNFNESLALSIDRFRYLSDISIIDFIKNDDKIKTDKKANPHEFFDEEMAQEIQTRLEKIQKNERTLNETKKFFHLKDQETQLKEFLKNPFGTHIESLGKLSQKEIKEASQTEEGFTADDKKQLGDIYRAVTNLKQGWEKDPIKVEDIKFGHEFLVTLTSVFQTKEGAKLAGGNASIPVCKSYASSADKMIKVYREFKNFEPETILGDSSVNMSPGILRACQNSFILQKINEISEKLTRAECKNFDELFNGASSEIDEQIALFNKNKKITKKYQDQLIEKLNELKKSQKEERERILFDKEKKLKDLREKKQSAQIATSVQSRVMPTESSPPAELRLSMKDSERLERIKQVTEHISKYEAAQGSLKTHIDGLIKTGIDHQKTYKEAKSAFDPIMEDIAQEKIAQKSLSLQYLSDGLPNLDPTTMNAGPDCPKFTISRSAEGLSDFPILASFEVVNKVVKATHIALPEGPEIKIFLSDKEGNEIEIENSRNKPAQLAIEEYIKQGKGEGLSIMIKKGDDVAKELIAAKEFSNVVENKISASRNASISFVERTGSRVR